MAKDTRELLVDAAPRPRHAQDFEQLWERGRRQRRSTRLAGTVGVVVLLLVVGVGLVQLAGPGPAGVPVVDTPEPEALEELRGRGQQFGQAETADGVPYAGRLRVGQTPMRPDGTTPDQDEVCVALQIGEPGERSTSQGCGLLENYLEGSRTLWTQSREPTRSGVVAWSPREVDHAIWELAGEQVRVEASPAPGLPGSVFVIAIDGQPQEETEVVMHDAEGEVVATIPVEVDDDAPGQEQVVFELGAASVWTSQPQTSLAEAAEAFASQALGWEAVTLDHDQPSTGPVEVTISGPDSQEIEVMFSPDSAENDTWHILQVGDGAGTLMSDPLALDLDTVPPGADHAQVWVGRHGRTHQLDVDRDQLADGRIELDGRFQDPDDIVAALVIYRDAQGLVLEAGGGHYASEAAP